VQPSAFGLQIERAGKQETWVDGQPIRSAAVTVGQTVVIPGQFVFLVVRRPVGMPLLRHYLPRFDFPFGEVDPFGMVGETPAAWALRERLAFVAKARVHALLHGPTGAGKEAAARAIHGMGPFAAGPYVTVSSGNVAESLREDELFGHAKDYPEKGLPARKGLFGAANGGILFYDEIASLSPEAQNSLLRVLDHGEYKPLGQEGTLRSFFTLVAAMNQALETLQLDLRKRFGALVVVPGLAERREDIPLLVRHVLRERHAKDSTLTAHLVRPQTDGTSAVVPPASFIEELVRRPSFDGNVRDVVNAVTDMLFDAAPPQGGTSGSPSARPAAPAADEGGAHLTKQDIEWLLTKHAGNVSAAANEAKTTRQSFYRAMERTGVKEKKTL
jgi:two-component system response regulator HydG